MEPVIITINNKEDWERLSAEIIMPNVAFEEAIKHYPLNLCVEPVTRTYCSLGVYKAYRPSNLIILSVEEFLRPQCNSQPLMYN